MYHCAEKTPTSDFIQTEFRLLPNAEINTRQFYPSGKLEIIVSEVVCIVRLYCNIFIVLQNSSLCSDPRPTIRTARRGDVLETSSVDVPAKNADVDRR